jgi:hypothetical protein
MIPPPCSTPPHNLDTDVDNADGVVIDSNYIYSKNPFYYRTTTYTWPATGILVGAETWMVRLCGCVHIFQMSADGVAGLQIQANPQPSFNVTIKNNLLVGTNGISNFYVGTVRRRLSSCA